MEASGSTDLAACLDRLRRRAEPPPLVPRGVWDPTLSRSIEALEAPPEVRSALFLWNDQLDRAHALAQEIDTPLGRCLHGTMHRREPDYENSRYWFRRVKPHPCGAAILRAARELAPARLRETLAGWTSWDAPAMVDWCEEAARSKDLDPFLRRLQARELEALAALCIDTRR